MLLHPVTNGAPTVLCQLDANGLGVFTALVDSRYRLDLGARTSCHSGGRHANTFQPAPTVSRRLCALFGGFLGVFGDPAALVRRPPFCALVIALAQAGLLVAAHVHVRISFFGFRLHAVPSICKWFADFVPERVFRRFFGLFFLLFVPKQTFAQSVNPLDKLAYAKSARRNKSSCCKFSAERL